MKHQGRQIHNSKVVKGWVSMTTSQCMTDIVARKKAEKRKQFESTHKFQAETKGRKIAQEFSSIKAGVVEDLRKLATQTSQELLEFIATELKIDKKSKKINNYVQPTLTLEQIKKVVNDCLPVIKKLKLLCENQDVKPSNMSYPTVYETMFINLIELDSRFALFASKDILNRASVVSKIEFLLEEIQNKINSLKEQLELNEDMDYVSTTEIDKFATKGVENEKIQSMLDLIEEGEFRAKLDMVKEAEHLSSNIYNFIISELDLQDYDEKKLKYGDIKDVLVLCQPAILSLKEISGRKDLNEVAGWEQFDPHTELFNRLMDINIKFSFFAPIKSLYRLDIDFKRLSEQERNVMKKVLIDNGLWDNDEFYENYRDLFENKNTNDNTI